MDGGECLLSCVDGLGIQGKALKSQHFPRRQNWIPSLDHMNSMGIEYGCRTTVDPILSYPMDVGLLCSTDKLSLPPAELLCKI